MDTDQCGQKRERELISFPRWAEVLARAEALRAPQREAYRRAIIAFLAHCKHQHAGASIILIQSYLRGMPEPARAGAREALRWWYRAAGRQGADGGQTADRVKGCAPRGGGGRTTEADLKTSCLDS